MEQCTANRAKIMLPLYSTAAKVRYVFLHSITDRSWWIITNQLLAKLFGVRVESMVAYPACELERVKKISFTPKEAGATNAFWARQE